MSSNYYCKDFWEKNGWASCFECDIIFYDLEKLYEHQNTHIDEEKSSKLPITLTAKPISPQIDQKSLK